MTDWIRLSDGSTMLAHPGHRPVSGMSALVCHSGLPLVQNPQDVVLASQVCTEIPIDKPNIEKEDSPLWVRGA